ncbi:MAG: RlmE family RNA methyltransferase [Magnetospirillum sp.]|jgi:23S rRNA (uridine2552-2'-O)-methyltransferase|nr:RlmE family RNA methyltransferase [Magnetospirillum sp.]
MTERRLYVKLKTAKGRTTAQQQWISRQLNDPYVGMAKDQGYRSRAAFKLIEIDAKYKFLKPGAKVVDLGAAPGGWTQVAVERGCTTVIALDILEMAPLAGAHVLKADFLDPAAPGMIEKLLDGKVDLVLSDMAPSTTGHRETDHLRIAALVEAAIDFAVAVLRPGGNFVTKFRQGQEEQALIKHAQRHFAKVVRMKPPSSRAESSELFLVSTGFKG